MAISAERVLPGALGLPKEATAHAPTLKPEPTLEEIIKMSENVPSDLTPKNPVETPGGTWRKDGSYTIFYTHDISLKQESVPHVEDINEYASRIVEAEIAAKSPIHTVRRPLSVRKIVSLLPIILG